MKKCKIIVPIFLITCFTLSTAYATDDSQQYTPGQYINENIDLSNCSIISSSSPKSSTLSCSWNKTNISKFVCPGVWKETFVWQTDSNQPFAAPVWTCTSANA